MTLARVLVFTSLLGGLFAAPAAHAIEEPAFEVEQVFPTFEIRRYPPYRVAEMLVPGPAEDAVAQAFPTLLAYISGKNKGERKLAMTAPVTQAPAQIAMTTPVTQSAAGDGFRVQFVMPGGSTLATLPEPIDAKVLLREVPAQRVAVIRYSGGWSQAAYEAQLGMLKAALAEQRISWHGEPVFSRYDGPFTLWFLRRNEVWLAVD